MQRSGRGVGLALVGVTGGAALALSIIAAPFITPALRKVGIYVQSWYLSVVTRSAEFRSLVLSLKYLHRMERG